MSKHETFPQIRLPETLLNKDAELAKPATVATTEKTAKPPLVQTFQLVTFTDWAAL